MFDPIKLMNILKKANDLKCKIENELKKIYIQNSTGNGIIKIKMNGQFEINEIQIDPDIFYQKDIKFLEDLIKSSINETTYKIKILLINKIKNIIGNISFLK